MTGRIPDTMRAAFVERLGGPENITVGRVDVPPLGPTDLLVRFEASAVNFVDLFVRSGAYPTPTPFPFVIGRDLVGRVVAAGSGAASFAEGERVWTNSLGVDGRQGSFAEYAVVAADRAYRLPGHVEPEEAAAVLHTGATAYLGLHRHGGLRAGETVLIAGAAGGVGSAAVQLATAAGAHVVATAAPRDHDWCRDLGAGEVLDYSRSDLHDAVAAAAPSGVDVWWDQSGTQQMERALPLMAPGGRVLITAGLQNTLTFPAGQAYTRDVSLHGFAISNASVDDLALASERIGQLLVRGRLRSRVARRLPLDEARAAHELLESGGVHGKIVMTPWR